MKQSPYRKLRTGSVPQCADDKDDQNVDVFAKCPLPVSAKRKIDIFRQPDVSDICQRFQKSEIDTAKYGWRKLSRSRYPNSLAIPLTMQV